MPSVRLMPYATPEPESIHWECWWFERGGTREALPQLLPGWDYASAETIGLTIHVDTNSLLARTGLTSPSDCAVVLVADCAPLGRRFVGTSPLADAQSQSIEASVEIPPGEAAIQLELTAHLILTAGTEASGRVAHLAGSRLLSSPRRLLQLEGEASRFPSEAVPFSAIGYESAPWTISASFADLNDSFMGSVRLLINEDHPWGLAALAPEENPETAQRLKVDVFRMLVAAIASEVEESAEVYEEASVGEVVSNMADLYLRQSLVEAASMYREDPLRFERTCYAAVGE